MFKGRRALSPQQKRVSKILGLETMDKIKNEYTYAIIYTEVSEIHFFTEYTKDEGGDEAVKIVEFNLTDEELSDLMSYVGARIKFDMY